MRCLKADEIECRIAAVKATGISLILYKDARCDQRLLDEEFGPLNWQRSHESIDGNLYCTVSVWDDEKKQWISKQDVGKESYTEKEKGRASDSFKRACFNFGIGRELYTAPFIWIPSTLCSIKKDEEKGTYKCSDSFEVLSVEYEEQKIKELKIINSTSRVEVFTWKDQGKAETFQDGKIDKTKLKILVKQLQEDEIPSQFVCDLYEIKTLEELKDSQFVYITTNRQKLKAKYNERNN